MDGQASATIYQVIVFQWLNTALRYVLIAGLAYLIYWRWFRDKFSSLALYPFPKSKQLKKELSYSLQTTVIFMLPVIYIFYLNKTGWMRIYFKVSDYGWGWYFASFIILNVFHDAYFYWTHRLMHHPKWFKRIHRVHHESIHPTPFTAYSFDAAEAFVQSSVVPLALLFMPLHFSVIFFFTIFAVILNVYGHLGVDLNRKRHEQGFVMKYMNSPRSHAKHHSAFLGNYSLYFNFWDRIMGTLIK